MPYVITKLTDQELAETKAAYPLANAKRFKLTQGPCPEPSPHSLLLSYHDTEEQAVKAKRQWEGRDEISERLEQFVDELVEVGAIYELEKDEVLKILKES